MNRILVIEDEDVMAATLKDVLESEGYEVFTARNGADGLRLLAEKKPDLILLDLMLPILDGRAFLNAKERDPSTCSTAVVAMTSASTEVLSSYTVDGFLQKPFVLEELLGQVRKYLHKKGGGSSTGPGARE